MMKNAAGGVLVFTLIEAVAFAAGVGLWFFLERRGQPVTALVVGTIIWTVVIYVEHFVSVNVGWGQPFFKGFPARLFKD